MPSLKNGNSKPAYWRSMDQLADTDDFRQFVEKEFPGEAGQLDSPVTRRSFLTVMGASMALAGLTGCRKPVEHIVPYVSQPEDAVIGKPQFYATVMPRGTAPLGVVVETHEGRPTKIEGNELHPSSLGSSDLLALGSMLNMYDPDRSKRNLQNGAIKTWDDFVGWWQEHEAALAENRGEGFALLSESFASPTLNRLRSEFLKKYPRARWIAYDPISEENRDRGLAAATGSVQQPVYQFEDAEIILSLESDFLQGEEESVKHSRAFAAGRRVMKPEDTMNRLYVVESGQSTTGSMADHRLRMPAGRIAAFTAALALELEKKGLSIAGSDALAPYASHNFDRTWLEAVADDLLHHRGKSLVTAGRRQPAGVHALVYAINDALGNHGHTIRYRSREDVLGSDSAALKQLVDEMKGGQVGTLVMLGGNPVYNAPADLDFAGALKGVDVSVHLSEFVDETSKKVTWHLTRTHFLEMWGDARATDGSVSVIQPMIDPLYGSHSEIELVALMVSGEPVRGHDAVQETWMGRYLRGEGERGWRRVLHDGILANSGEQGGAPRVNARGVSSLLRDEPFSTDEPTRDNLEFVFASSYTLYDGRYANNGWLVEAPDPISKMSWSNAALLSKKTADDLGVKEREALILSANGVDIELPVYVVPGHADNSITLEMGWGRKGFGRVADGHGADIFPMRTSAGVDFALGGKATGTGRKLEIANTQDHGSMEGREIIREATLDTYRKHPKFAKEMVHVPDLKSLWKDWTWSEGYQWGMAIDLNVCTGCNACVIACQSENNVPVVGKDPVRNGREMHWMRLDRYFVGTIEDGRMVNQPMMCQHCEMAPCEQVCPVNATSHDNEGLNVMTYNRCIGTRYCSNNCPYKVRRFNFFNYTNKLPELIQMAQNPDVTVRSRGVMEKCTFCTQRINAGKYQAKAEGREVRDGEVKTACQQACPTNAISFGNINDPKSEVSSWKKNSRNYGVLEEFNTRPRTTYLARLHNPNPKLGDPVFDTEFVPHGGGHGEGHGSNGHGGNDHGAEAGH
ncbi:TAT-variant-translocated molybdopterin oxidoreductase [bacterium]|nr:TAT-variant-translocated molybdopterin oxidoreductase [bacterium]